MILNDAGYYFKRGSTFHGLAEFLEFSFSCMTAKSVVLGLVRAKLTPVRISLVFLACRSRCLIPALASLTSGVSEGGDRTLLDTLFSLHADMKVVMTLAASWLLASRFIYVSAGNQVIKDVGSLSHMFSQFILVNLSISFRNVSELERFIAPNNIS